MTAVVGAATLLLALLSLGIGEVSIGLGRIVPVLLGHGTSFEQLVLVQWRIPTVLAAIVFGASLGLAGTIVQTLTRNPLGSPDLIGIDVGAFTGVAVAMIVLGVSGTWPVVLAALVGGIATAGLVTALAYRRGLTAFRLIVVGIAVAAVLGSVNAYLITRADVGDAMAVGLWGAGSLSRVSWAQLVPSIVVVIAVLGTGLALRRRVRSLELGDEVAGVHGVPVLGTRLGLVGLAVAATAVVTAFAGPLAFVALAAPHVARRVTRAPGIALVPAAVTGAFVLTTANVASMALGAAGFPAPVGLVTVCLGGTYLLTLLMSGLRR
jgi:iron complex transport system permease protein